MKERPAAGVHSGGILERAPRLCLHIRIPELVGGLRALSRVTWLAGEGQIADAVRASACLGHDALDVKWPVRRAAVGALPAELLQQILADLITGQFALLVFHPTDLWILQELSIEADYLLGESSNRSNPAEPPHPGQDVADARLQGGWKPAFGASAVVEAGGAVTSRALTASSATHAPLVQPLPHPLSPVEQLRCPYYLARGIVHDG